MSADLYELHAGTRQLCLQCDTVIKFNFIFVPSRFLVRTSAAMQDMQDYYNVLTNICQILDKSFTS